MSTSNRHSVPPSVDVHASAPGPRLRLRLGHALLAVLLGAAPATWAATAPDPPPLLDLHVPTLILHPGEERSVTVPFTIPTGHRFLPHRVERSCSCLHVDALPEEAIAAGDSREVHAEISAGELTGAIASEFTIFGEDEAGAAARIRFSLTADIRESLIWPRGTTIDLGERERAALPASTTIVVRRGAHPQAYDQLVIAVEGGDGLLTTTVRPMGEDQWAIDLGLAATPVTGTTTARLIAGFSDHGRVCDFHADRLVRWTTLGPWQTRPSGILFGVVPIDGSARKNVLLQPRDGAPARAQVLGVTSSDPERAACQVVEDGGVQHLVASFSGASPQGAASGHFDVRFADGGVLRVPYFAGIGPAAGAPPDKAAPESPPAKF